jgi:hypothetical protein
MSSKLKKLTEDIIIKNIEEDCFLREYVFKKIIKFDGGKTKLLIYCPIHDSCWEVRYDSFYHRKSLCPKCSTDLRRLSRSEILKRVKEVDSTIENKFYKKSKDGFEEISDKDIITANDIFLKRICPKHGDYFTSYDHILGGRGCPSCNKPILTKESIINNTTELDSSVENKLYKKEKGHFIEIDNPIGSIKTYLKRNCSKHGEYFTSYNNIITHTRGCPCCKFSKGEKEIEMYLKNNNIDFISQYKIKNEIFQSRESNSVFIDFMIKFSDQTYFIEYNGKQHYQSVEYFGGEEKFRLQQERDNEVRVFCSNNNIKLIEIPYSIKLFKIKELLNKYFKK